MSPSISKSYVASSLCYSFRLNLTQTARGLPSLKPTVRTCSRAFNAADSVLRRAFGKGRFSIKTQGNSNKQWGNKKSSSISNIFLFPIIHCCFFRVSPTSCCCFFHISGYKTITYIPSFIFFFFGRNVVVPLGKIKVWSTWAAEF